MSNRLGQRLGSAPADRRYPTLHGRRVLFTTNYVLAESYTLARRRISHVAATRIAASFLMNSRDILLLHVTEGQQRRALELLRKHVDKPHSFADAAAFITIPDRGATEAFTFDHDFAKAGFTVLLGES